MLYDPDPMVLESDTESDSSYGYERKWPTYTNIVHVHGRELSLGQQHFEVKLAVRKGMDYMLQYLLFRDGFPSLATHALWGRRSLINASTSLESSVSAHAQEYYQQLSDHFKCDASYVRKLSRLVCIYI
jgi:hypothetical protein